MLNFDGDCFVERWEVRKSSNSSLAKFRKSTTTCRAGGLDFAAIGGKRQGREVPQSLRFGKPDKSRQK